MSTLIALIEYQVNQLQKKGVEATYLNSSHSFRDIYRLLDNVILILLNYEPKSHHYLYNQLKSLIKKDLFNSILKKIIKGELVLVNDGNLIYLSS